MRRLAFLAAASLALGVAVIVDQPASFAHHMAPKKGEFRSGGNLAHTNLKGVNLNTANLSGAILIGADLNGTQLSGADLTNVQWSNTICPDGTNSDVNGDTCEINL